MPHRGTDECSPFAEVAQGMSLYLLTYSHVLWKSGFPGDNMTLNKMN